ncbi:MAG TPA: CPBP family intramembrane glutamic endopeptidase [Verrucomicrobiae bacterium]|nr:CPBP family intramembrane glutamic endopeptidase [Verrucomicrobiae bacterium]
MIVADALGLVPLTLTIGLLPVVWVLLRLSREPWSSIGLSLPPHLPRAIAIGAAAGVAMELVAVFGTTPWISDFFGTEPDYSDLRIIQGNLKYLLIFLALNWTLAAFGEEICWRGFLMQRVARLFGGGTAAWASSLLLVSAIFGWVHSEEGLSGAVQEGLSGLLLGVLFLANGRNLTVPIVAHGVSNTVPFVLIYLGRYPGVG